MLRAEKKLSYMALLMNLRSIASAGVNPRLVETG
jgi:hypothetical protein